ncbi:hypothetical protein H2202_010796 [Exophiala xenobiotica]|nr:hypothetical protein H2202_010796 [Exophiala xenobiotica]KAK5226703.1 hypothetical protein LTR47_008931 [Exophiala xenobiotica]KAK5252717.1 hypothetical protein LTS06_002665 [Exophiala xenobiotica]KAK5348990.1 hypothetical protein LTR61_007571 [Exophiala xenobiotica]KAK5367449.1 hypothetical protein LTR11_007739 [Exophiala xenobiotica]
MGKQTPVNSVIIVGAGPSGLLLGILLAKEGVKVQIVEASNELDKNPRAAHYAPSAVYDLDRAGVLDDVKAQGIHPDAVCWRHPDGSFIAGIQNRMDIDHPMVCLPLDKLDILLLEHFLKAPNTEALWEHNVVSIEQDENEARVNVETPTGKKTFAADYVVGCDGANSQIRRSLFGDLNYPGETLQKQIIATNVYYDFHKFGYWDSNFILDENDWYMAARITNDGLWRVTYGDDWGLSNEEYLKRQPERFEKILPGSPKPGDYKLVSASPYKLHQRCAESFRVGRFLLAADAAHLCNPFGGFGLTGGIADVGSLFDALRAMRNGKADDSILDKYSEVRREKWAKIIDPMSRANFKRVCLDETEADRNEFWALCKKMEEDDELARQMAQGTNVLREDFREYLTV